FILLLLRHPPSPLFPYTTLFRSGRAGKLLSTEGDVDDTARVRHADALLPRADLSGSQSARVRPRPRLPRCARARGAFRDGVAIEDRKSTRLNSSHVKISYAVFCL